MVRLGLVVLALMFAVVLASVGDVEYVAIILPSISAGRYIAVAIRRGVHIGRRIVYQTLLSDPLTPSMRDGREQRALLSRAPKATMPVARFIE